MRLVRLVVVLTAVGAGACLAGAAVSSGVQGVVVRGPVTPVCRVGRPCSAPVAGALVVARRATRVVERTKTDVSGHFRLALAPGSYAVSVSFGTGLARATSVRRVEVVSGRFTPVRFVFDTRIR